jgi:hypothetical protein
MTMRLTPFLCAALAAGLAASPAAAQLCDGFPGNVFFAGASHNDLGTNTLYAGINPQGPHTFSANVAKPPDQANGSSSISYGVRWKYGTERRSWGLCTIVGYQRGYSQLLNAEGLHYNGHLTVQSVPVGFSYARAFSLGRACRLIVSAAPQFVFRSHKLDLVGRGDTLHVSDLSTDWGVGTGATLKFGPIYITAGGSKFSNDDGWHWGFGAGVSP